jgi:hypothetical protein
VTFDHDDDPDPIAQELGVMTESGESFGKRLGAIVRKVGIEEGIAESIGESIGITPHGRRCGLGNGRGHPRNIDFGRDRQRDCRPRICYQRDRRERIMMPVAAAPGKDPKGEKEREFFHLSIPPE